MLRLLYLLGAGLLNGPKEGYEKWKDERYRAHKWKTARCVFCSGGFMSDEAIYDTSKGQAHRHCWYSLRKT